MRRPAMPQGQRTVTIEHSQQHIMAGDPACFLHRLLWPGDELQCGDEGYQIEGAIRERQRQAVAQQVGTDSLGRLESTGLDQHGCGDVQSHGQQAFPC
jgi:hypothetical protein